MADEIRLNADMGEGYSAYAMPMQVWRGELERGGSIMPSVVSVPSPRRVMELVSSVSLACGFHAGDPLVIREYVALAAETRCSVGAHPSYPDRDGFGNRYMAISKRELGAIIQYQLGALVGFLGLYQLPLDHVKCHGALYFSAMNDESVALSVAEATAQMSPGTSLFGMPGSALEHQAQRLGVPFLREAYADRAYRTDGTIISALDRERSDGVVNDPEAVARRVLEMARDGTVMSVEKETVTLDPDTICFHPDTPQMMEMLERTIDVLGEAGIVIQRKGR